MTPVSLSRLVVRMAMGAALYGVFSWMTNVLALPSGSLISLRPAILVPVFFGYSWGVWVGLFTGLVGNAIGDLMTGWGVSLTWTLGNGILGGIAGLARLPAVRSASTGALATLFAVLLVALTLFVRRSEVAGLWPYPAALALAQVAFLLWLPRAPAEARGVLFGLAGVYVGMAAASLGDVWYSRMTVESTLLTQFLSACVSNALIVILLGPSLFRAYGRALDRAGR